MTVVEVANELLSDTASAQGAIFDAAISAVSNKILQQALYGNGVAPQLKGISEYAAEGFADAGDKSAVENIYSLVTAAKIALTKKNGVINCMLYDPDLDAMFDYQNAEGEYGRIPRSFEEMYKNSKVLPHPSVAAGDMFFMQSDALYLGIRQDIEVQIDPYSAFNSNNTKFRVIMRADIFPNISKMVYYNSVTVPVE
jgi:hypothetical protein